MSKVMFKNNLFSFKKFKFEKTKQKNIFIAHRVGDVVEDLGIYLSWFGLGESRMIDHAAKYRNHNNNKLLGGD